MTEFLEAFRRYCEENGQPPQHPGPPGHRPSHAMANGGRMIRIDGYGVLFDCVVARYPKIMKRLADQEGGND